MEKLGSFLKGRQTLSCKGKLFNISKPLVMGVINITKDSFFEGSRFTFKYRIAKRAEQILLDGGAIIDVGACSTRPNSTPVDEATELKRLSKAFSIIRKKFPDAILSVDTYRSNVARKMVQEFDVNIVNDISAGELDPEMFKTVADLKVPYVLMHMKGNPANMQENPHYDDLIGEIFSFLTKKIEQLDLFGVNDIIIDPGFGFGKNIDHNFTLLRNLNAFQIFELPIMVGLSRKSMIYKTLNTCPSKALNGTTALNTIALLEGASILRVHDVREAVDAAKLMEIYNLQPTYQ
jgi:dihydropteroate synthase